MLAEAKVYVVDDDDAVRDSLKLLLESYGLTVETFDSIGTFLRSFRPNARASCLVLDQHLPGTTGLDFLGSPEGRRLDIPVILVTGRGDAVLRARAFDAGAIAYFEKPVDDGALVSAIERALSGG